MNENIQFFTYNILRNLQFWSLLHNASISGNYIKISSGGTAGCILTNDYFNGLQASKYRYIKAEITTDPSSISNYANNIDVVIKGVYIDSNKETFNTYISTNFNSYYNSVNNVVTLETIISVENMDFINCDVYIVNHTSNAIQLNSCVMYRSLDVNSSQIGESIGWGVTLEKVIAYRDGCEIYYKDMAKPDRLWYLTDQSGNFNGVNVNKERQIIFQRVNLPLID